MDQRSVRVASRVMLVLVAVYAACVQGVAGPQGPLAAASTLTSTCPGAFGTGCVEVRITPTGGRPAPGRTLRELQLNLCHSGLATDCYHGTKTTAEAASIVYRYLPSVVTMAEICSADVVGSTSAIQSAMIAIARQEGDASVFALFAPAVNRNTGQPYKCADGDTYGVGLVGRGSLTGQVRHYLYSSQDTRSDEERVGECAPADGYDVCTTHLESDNGTVAMNQCHQLIDDYAGAFRTSTGEPPTVVAGDFNTRNIQDCVPPAWAARGDGGVQHVVATGFTFATTRTVYMRYTDHPALIVDLTG